LIERLAAARPVAIGYDVLFVEPSTADAALANAIGEAGNVVLPVTFSVPGINGAPFETLLGQSPNDPLVLMMARGPAGYRFTTKALQHAIPDAKIERGEVTTLPGSVALQVWLSGTLRGTVEAVNAVVAITLKLAAAGPVEVADATIDSAMLEKIRTARLRP